MSEPVTLHSRYGETITVYTRSQAAALLAGGQWFATAADANAGTVREEPTPTTAAKLDALEAGGAGIVTEVVTEAPAPESPTPPVKTTAAKGRRATGGL